MWWHCLRLCWTTCLSSITAFCFVYTEHLLKIGIYFLSSFFFILNAGISPCHLYIVFSLLWDPLIVQKFISFYFCIFSGYYWILTSRICHWTWRLEFCQRNGASMLSLCLYCLTDSLFWASPSDRFFKIMVFVVPLADSKSWVFMFHILVRSFAVHFWWSYNFLAILCHYDVLNRWLFTHNFNTLYISN